MALKLPQKAKKVSTSYILPKDGIYRVIIAQALDKVDDFENSRRRGNHYYNLRLEYENKRVRFERVDYMNAEGDKESFGYNFILSMKEIAIKATEIHEKLREELETQDTDSDQVFNALIDNKVPIYMAFRNTKSDKTGDTYTNINNYFDPFYELTEEIQEDIEKRKLEIIDLEPEEEDPSTENDYIESGDETDEDSDW